jgi:CRP-like cAMP-binding protein
MYQEIRASFLSFVPALTSDDLDQVCLRLRPTTYKRKAIVLAEGEVCRHVYFINTGAVRLFNQQAGLDRVAMYVFENNWISEYRSFITQSPAQQALQAVEETQLLALGYDDVQALYNTNPKFERFGRLMAEFIFAHATANELEATLYTPEQRYLQLIEKNSIMLARLSQQQIAAYLGVQPESLSRIRKRLAQKS